MSFRDENEAARAKNEALQRELDATKDQLESARQELARAKKPEAKPAARTSDAPASPARRRRTVLLAVGAVTVPVIATLVVLVSSSLSFTPVEERVGARIVLPDCSCTSPDGHRYALEGVVTGVGPDRSIPGRPTGWSIQWALISGATRTELDSMGAPNTAIIGPLNYSLGIACPRNDRVAIAGGGSVSMFAREQGHALWTTTVMDSYESGGGLWGSGLRVSCDHFEHDGTYLRMPVRDGADTNVRIDSGRIEY